MAESKILLESGTNELEIVEFFIHEQMPDGTTYVGYYGVNVAKVLEIIRMPKYTEMPNAPHPSVVGAFTQRGHVVPLVDLSVWLQKNMVAGDERKVIVTQFNNVVTAFLVSGVNRIHRISWEDVEAPNLYVSRFSEGSITGVVNFPDRILFLVDMERVVADLNPSLAFQYEQEELDRQRESCTDTMRALVVDDSTVIRRTVARTMESAGYEVQRSFNGKAAWDVLAEARQKSEDEGRPITDFFNVIISDIEMPVMDGHNLTKRIKDDPVLAKLPVILFSSLISDSLRHKGEAVGADDQICKPELGTLARRSRELIEKYQGVCPSTIEA